MRRAIRTTALALAPAALVLMSGAAASAAGARVIFSEILASSTSDVPGIPGAKWGAFDRPYRSADGTRWVIGGDIAGAAATANEVVVTGMGLTGSLGIREGIAAPWAPAETIDGGIIRNLAINDSGQFLFAANTSAATTADQYIVRGETTPGMFTVMRKEGQAVSAVGGTALFGATLEVAGLQNDGKAGYRATMTTVPAGFGTTGLFIGEDMVANTANVALRPTGQLTGGTENWSTLDSQDYYINHDGSRWSTAGGLAGAAASNIVYALNNSIVHQESFPITGGSGNMSLLTDSMMTPNGDFWVRGSYATSNVDWVATNGSVVRETDQSVPGGLPGEMFDDGIFTATFFSMTSNSLGDFVYGGVTNNADIAKNAVLVYNNLMVICREGDGVDLDGNGLLDDNVFVSVFNNDDNFLTDDGYYYFTADLVDGAGTALGQGFMRVLVPAPGTAGALAIALGLMGARRRRG